VNYTGLFIIEIDLGIEGNGYQETGSGTNFVSMTFTRYLDARSLTKYKWET